MRFTPDSLLQALLRPLAMAWPDANVYVEIMAPDFRFTFLLALLVLLGLFVALRGQTAQGQARRPVFVLLAVLLVAFGAWLATTGNGRYFMPGLLLVGPVSVGLAALLPVTRALRLTLATGMLLLQVFAVQQASPWRAWTLVSWKEPPVLPVALPAEARAVPATYVTMSAISYSLLAPRFHPDSRWINLHNAPAPGGAAVDGPRTEAFLAKAQPGRLMLLVPVIGGMMEADGTPNDAVAQALAGQLAPYRLGFGKPRSCRFLAAPALADLELGERTQEERSRAGFWLCHLTRLEAGAMPPAPRATRHDAVFRALEAQCPRFFPAGGDHGSVALPHGEVRSYLQSEMKAYVNDSGEVYYKYYRALNNVLVGTARDVLAGTSRVDCDHIRGRSGLPWERDI